VLARVARVTATTRELAELVCIVRGRTDRWLLEQVLRTVELDEDGCLGIGIVRDEDDALSFRHELARRALEDSLPPARRQALHARVLSALAARPGVAAARLVHHADGACAAARVLQCAPIAADEAAAVGAHGEAASHYEVALRYAGELSPRERAVLQERAAYEWELAGEYQRAIEQRCGALSTWRASGDHVRAGNTLRWLSSLSCSRGDLATANRHGIDAVTTLESVPPGPELAMAYCNRADLDMEVHEADSAIAWAQRAIELAKSCGSEAILIHALNRLGTIRLLSGHSTAGFDLERTLELALAGHDQAEVARAYMNLGAMTVSRRDYPRASRYLGAGLALCSEHGLDSVRLYLLAYRGRMRFEQGDWVGASGDVEAVLRDPRATPITSIPALRTLGHIKVRRGDGDASAPLDRIRVLSQAHPQLLRVGFLATIRAEAAWLAGDREGVIREARPAYDLVRDRCDPLLKGELAAWLSRARALDESPADIAAPYAREIAGDWRGAALAWNALGCPYENACVLGWYAGEDEQREALAVLERIGARPAAQALRRQMRARGVRGVPRGSRPSTRSNPFGLTRRESEILSLLSEGLRNAAIGKRLFVSTKTVDHHVSAILSKLAVPSRVHAVLFARGQLVHG
jgi:DNA-binding CsgD family transcriptional regulator/tetratricopeptide (TPR) repeat protein